VDEHVELLEVIVLHCPTLTSPKEDVNNVLQEDLVLKIQFLEKAIPQIISHLQSQLILNQMNLRSHLWHQALYSEMSNKILFQLKSPSSGKNPQLKSKVKGRHQHPQISKGH
jgi:hypothetical protein